VREAQERAEVAEAAAAVEPDAIARPSLLARFRDRDHTRGSLLGSIGVLALPSVLTSIGGMAVFQLVELRFLGALGPEALAAVGSTNQTLLQFFMLVGFGVSVAAQMMIGRLVGAGRIDAAEHVAGQTFALGGALWIVTALSGLLFAEPMVALVARDPAVVELASLYVRLSFTFFLVGITGQLAAATLNGAGDTTTPMLISFVVTPVALSAQWALAFGNLGLPPLGVAGIAIGSAAGSAAGVAVSLWALASGRCRVHLHRRHFVPDPALLRRVAGLSWQPALHMLARTTIVFFFMALAGRLDGKVQAAYTIGLRIEMVPIMIAFPIANAASTLVSQNLGARDAARVWRSIRVAFALELALLWPVAGAIFWFRAPLVALFTHDPEVQALAAEFLIYSTAILGFYGLYFVAFRTLQAVGDMSSPMIISVAVALGLGAPLGWLLATRSDLGATGMWIANLVYASVNCALMVGWLWTGRWARALSEPARSLQGHG
jgi:putative MATE family efflux protein